MKRTRTAAQLAYPESYKRAVHRRRLISWAGANTNVYANMARFPNTPRVQIPARLVGKVRVAGNYGRYGGPDGELKYYDTGLALSATTAGVASTTAATGFINLIPQGDTEVSRDGRKCVIKSVSIRGNWQYLPAATAVGQADIIVYLMLDSQCNGAAPTYTDIFDAANLFEAHRNLANGSRFTVLKKKRLRMESGNGIVGAYGNVQKIMEINKKCSIPLEFNAAVGALTEIRSNNLFLVYGSTTGAACTFDGIARVRFLA